MNYVMLNGLGLADLGLFVIRLVLGGFFFLARFRWVYDPSAVKQVPSVGMDGVLIPAHWFNPIRLVSLQAKMVKCGYGNNFYLSAFVALAEIFAGLALIVGIFVVPASLGLLILLLFATRCTWREKTFKQNPVDKVHVAECYLWTPEPLYITLALLLFFAGGGVYSLDHFLFR